MDCDGPKIADNFYHTLFKAGNSGAAIGSSNSCPDTTESALSLHLAVARLRSENADFARWVPFIYLGL
jgi:hypothetical protein